MTSIDLAEAIWQDILTHLEKEKKRISEEIAHYPPPIPACDAQFNYLLEERARISQELSRGREAHTTSLQDKDWVTRINAFISASAYIEADQAQKLRSDLKEALSKDSV